MRPLWRCRAQMSCRDGLGEHRKWNCWILPTLQDCGTNWQVSTLSSPVLICTVVEVESEDTEASEVSQVSQVTVRLINCCLFTFLSRFNWWNQPLSDTSLKGREEWKQTRKFRIEVRGFLKNGTPTLGGIPLDNWVGVPNSWRFRLCVAKIQWADSITKRIRFIHSSQSCTFYRDEIYSLYVVWWSLFLLLL